MREIEESDEGGTLVLTLGWMSWQYAIVGLLALGAGVYGWASGFFARILGALGPGSGADFSARLVALLMFPAIAAFALAVYYGFCRVLGRTVLRAGEAELSARHGPLPWPPRNRLIDAASIESFRMGRRDQRTKAETIAFFRIECVAEGGVQPLSPWFEDAGPVRDALRALEERYGLPESRG